MITLPGADFSPRKVDINAKTRKEERAEAKEFTLDEYDPPQSPLLKGGSARAPLLAKERLGEVETILTNSYVEARNG